MVTKKECEALKYPSRRYEFQSQFLRGGNVVFPEVIIIQNGILTWSKKKIFGMDIKSMEITDISGIDIAAGVLATTLTIYGRGKGKIEANNFSQRAALTIKKITGK